MQAYIDDSQEDGRVLVYGGLIASADQWKAFSKDWQQCLDDAPWDVFKMKKVSRQWRRKNCERAQKHYRAVCEHVQGGICFVVPLEPLKKWAAHYGLAGTAVAEPYFWAPKGIINGLAQNQREWGLTGPVDFIFDKRPEAEEATIRKRVGVISHEHSRRRTLRYWKAPDFRGRQGRIALAGGRHVGVVVPDDLGRERWRDPRRQLSGSVG